MSDNIVSPSYRHLLLLPEEIVVDILLRLPSKSLLRFKSVCKRWRDLITNSLLIRHLLPTGDNDHHRLLVKRRDNNNKDHVFSFLPHHAQARPLPFPEIPMVKPPCFFGGQIPEPEIEILGPCNGLVCLFDTNNMMGHYIVLWRPADGEIKILPPSDVPNPAILYPYEVPSPAYLLAHHDDYDEDPYPYPYICNPQIGFGYDAENEDYKVVRWGGLECDNHLLNTKMEVYSFNKDCWKGVTIYDDDDDEVDNDHVYEVGADDDDDEEEDPLPYNLFYFSTACLSGMLFWWGSGHHIIWFRLSDESYGTITAPDKIKDTDRLGEPSDDSSYDVPRWYYNLFGINDENLALVAYDIRSMTEKCFQVWVLFEFAQKESWTRVFTVGPLVRVQRPLWLWRNCKIVMENIDGELISYDLLTNDMETLSVCGVPGSLRVISIEDKYIPS